MFCSMSSHFVPVISAILLLSRVSDVQSNPTPELELTLQTVLNLNNISIAQHRLAEQISNLSNGIIEALIRQNILNSSSTAANPTPISVRPLPVFPPIGCESIGRNGSNVYAIRTSNSSTNTFDAYCLMAESPDEHAWTVVLRRSDEKTSFNRIWSEYRYGFGDASGDHWIGLKRLHELTSARPHELRIEIVDYDDQHMYVSYNAFVIDDESNAFAIRVLGESEGTLGDAFFKHVGHKFSTIDEDNDENEQTNCAYANSGGGWFIGNPCFQANLMGEEPSVTVYSDWGIPYTYMIKTVRMMIRSKNYTEI